MRAGIPADAAPPHGERRLLHPAEIAVEGDVDRPADDMLAMLGDPEGGGRQHLVGLLGAIGREDGSVALVGGGHDIGQKIQHGEIDRPGLVGVEIAQEDGQIGHGAGQGPGRVAVGAGEGLAGMGVLEREAAQLGRTGERIAGQQKRHAGREQQVAPAHSGTVPMGVVLALRLFDKQLVGHPLKMGRAYPAHKVCGAAMPCGTRQEPGPIVAGPAVACFDPCRRTTRPPVGRRPYHPRPLIY